MATVSVSRYHDISMGHRVVGHAGKCRHLHGHNYRIHFQCEVPADSLDGMGMVIDFGVIKEKLCMWLESEWDHKMVLWDQDPIWRTLPYEYDRAECGLVLVPFNPTAEQIALHLLQVVGPAQLAGTGVRLTAVRVEETAKCSASASL